MAPRKYRLLNGIDPSILLLFITFLIGGYIRLAYVLQSDFPINDGGLFYTLIKDLMANHYRLPLTTSYNHLNLPFAYPPFIFYLSGFLADLTSWGLINIIRILPAIFTVLTIPAFFLLASVLIENRDQVVFATCIFTFIPASFYWLIMGGGLTRAPAFFFALLSLYFIYRLYTRDQIQDILWTTVFSSLTVLTQPETALHTAVSALVFFFFFGRDKKGLLKSIAVAGLTIVFTAPWWATVLIHEGFTPFMAAGGTGFHNFGEMFQLFQFGVTNEYGLKTIGTLGLIGLFWHLAQRKYFVPVWAAVIFISEPRSAPLYLSPCVAIFASYSLTNILQIFNKIELPRAAESREPHPLSGKVAKGLFFLLAVPWVISSIGIIALLVNSSVLTNVDQNAFNWIKLNTSGESRFLVLSGDSPFTDPVSEWFPALTERTSIATVQGQEWASSGSFDKMITEEVNVQKCMYLTYSCIESWAEKNHKVFDYIYVHDLVHPSYAQFRASLESAPGDLSPSGGYIELVYKNDDVSIYKVK
jgi:hypothetical protein